LPKRAIFFSEFFAGRQLLQPSTKVNGPCRPSQTQTTPSLLSNSVTRLFPGGFVDSFFALRTPKSKWQWKPSTPGGMLTRAGKQALVSFALCLRAIDEPAMDRGRGSDGYYRQMALMAFNWWDDQKH
jgi:hypothetical protein